MKRYFIPYIYIVIFLLNAIPASSQKLVLKISPKDSLNTIYLNSIQYQKIHDSESALIESIDSLRKQIEQRGFLNSKLDTIVKLDTIYTAWFNLGLRNDHIKIFYDAKDISSEQILKISPSSTNDYFVTETKKLSEKLDDIVGIFENEGKSFVQVSLKDISVDRDTIEAYLYIKNSDQRKIDKVILTGYKDFPKSYLKHYLRIKESTLFSSDKLDQISARLKRLPFIEVIKPPEVLFTRDSTLVYLYFNKKQANTFDGLIGFASKEVGNGIQFNGYLDLALNNVFNGGESFSIYWKNNGNERQVFNINTAIPYIFNSRVSPQMELNIYKQDSSFINTKFQLKLPYQLNERSSLGLSIQSESSTDLLTINTGDDIRNFNNIFYGLNYNFHVPNDHDIFIAKFSLFSEILLGSRNLENVNSPQTKLYFKSNHLWSLNNKNHIFIQNESSTLISSDNLFKNELFRIGGSNSIRGFNEESIQATTLSYFNFEYRYMTNMRAYLYSITDAGYVNNSIINTESKIFALGLGYAFSTKFGLLDLSYAVGGISNEPFNFDNSRFHIKIISFF